jgi:hypothetical protein
MLALELSFFTIFYKIDADRSCRKDIQIIILQYFLLKQLQRMLCGPSLPPILSDVPLGGYSYKYVLAFPQSNWAYSGPFCGTGVL